MRDLLNSNMHNLQRFFNTSKEYLKHNPGVKYSLLGLSIMGMIYTYSKITENNQVIYRDRQAPNFEQGRILGTQKESYLHDKKIQLSKAAKKIMAKNKILEDRLHNLEKQLEAKI